MGRVERTEGRVVGERANDLLRSMLKQPIDPTVGANYERMFSDLFANFDLVREAWNRERFVQASIDTHETLEAVVRSTHDVLEQLMSGGVTCEGINSKRVFKLKPTHVHALIRWHGLTGQRANIHDIGQELGLADSTTGRIRLDANASFRFVGHCIER